MKKLKKGFTLIELLVVISIIGILASLTLVSYTGAQKQTRDTQRRSDLNQYRNALESYAASNGGMYPDDSLSGAVEASKLCSSPFFSPFMSMCPSDPMEPSHSYVYGANGSGDTGTPVASNYFLYVKGGLETGGTWVVCSTGKVGKIDNTDNWSVLWEFCGR